MAEQCDATNIPCRVKALEEAILALQHPPMEVTFVPTNEPPYFNKAEQKVSIPLPPQCVEDSWDVEVVDPETDLSSPTYPVYASHAPLDLEISAGVRINFAQVGTNTVTVQIFVDGVQLFLTAPVFSEATTLVPFSSIDPSLATIPAGARITVSITSADSYSGWKGMNFSVIHEKKLCGVDTIIEPTRFPDFGLWPLHFRREPLRDTDGTTPLNGSWGSGATFWPERGTILIINNSPAAIGEFTVEGVCIRRALLSGFGDVEGVCVWKGDDGAGKGQFAICAEDQKIYQIEVPFEGAWATLVMGGSGWVSTIDASAVMPANANLGLEAITYDPVQDIFMVCNQAVGTDGNWGVWAFPRLSPLTPFLVFRVEHALPLAEDIDDMTLTPHGTLLFLGHDSPVEHSAISEVSYGSPTLSPGRLIQQSTYPELRQGEGIAVNPEGTRLWVVGEPASGTNSQMFVYNRP